MYSLHYGSYHFLAPFSIAFGTTQYIPYILCLCLLSVPIEGQTHEGRNLSLEPLLE